MRSTKNAPRWASALAARVATKYQTPTPRVVFTNPRVGSESVGRTFFVGDATPIVAITPGSCRIEQRLVLLHEFCHCVVGDTHHRRRFVDVAAELYQLHGICRQRVRNREGFYFW